MSKWSEPYRDMLELFWLMLPWLFLLVALLWAFLLLLEPLLARFGALIEKL